MKTAIWLVALTLAVGCADAAAPDKGGEAQPLSATIDGKSDALSEFTTHEVLSFDSPNLASLDGSAGQVWSFSTMDTDRIRLEVVNCEADTVLYLFDQRGLLARDDDSGKHYLSRIEADLAPGDYQIVVKGFTVEDRGDFELVARCAHGTCFSLPY